MLFNSIEFSVFLPIVFLLYWFVFNKSIGVQNALIVVASYVFYGWWDWKFLSLILFSTLVDFFIGIKLGKQQNNAKRKILLFTSIMVNLGFLGFFKYYNFFVDNFVEAFLLFGVKFNPETLDIVLPVGISFYTFQTMSYSIDVYRKHLVPTKDFVAFTAYVSFFPQLVAGPIERAINLLPQFYKKRVFDYNLAVAGLRQILWGLFKKVVIADNCAEYANLIFNHSVDYSGLTLALGALFFSFQIYGDFSGYSDIAIGTSRLFGFDLMRNFNFPYFSRDVAEFWRRWHISLSTWFRDYLYIPLGGSQGKLWMKIRNTFLIFLISGFWHGANWTFIVWGALNAIYFLPLLLFKTNRNNLGNVASGKIIPSIKDLFKMSFTFVLIVFAWIFFRAQSMDHALQYIEGLFKSPYSYITPGIYWKYKFLLLLIAFFVSIEWLGRESHFAIEKMGLVWNRVFRWTFYLILALSVLLCSGSKQEFIYFQF